MVKKTTKKTAPFANLELSKPTEGAVYLKKKTLSQEKAYFSSFFVAPASIGTIVEASELRSPEFA